MIFYYSYLALGAFLLSLLGTRILILTLRKKRFLLDIPNARSNHAIPVPRGGGIAVVFTIFIFLMVIDASFSVMAGMLLLALVSLVDDWIRLSPVTRILVQMMAVLVALADVQIPFLTDYLPSWLANILIFLMWMWFINLFNFMDGIDGLSASESISLAGGIVFISALVGTFTSQVSLISLIILGAAFGFLWWNRHPAKIFLGDVGSIPLGYLLGYALLILAADGMVWAAIILPAYYLCDATITLLHRICRREKVWHAHSEHYYQQAVRQGMGHDTVVRYIFVVNALLMLLAALASLEPAMGWVYFAIAYSMVIAVLFLVLADTSRKP